MSRKKPAQVIVEPIYARAIRGPHKDGSGRWYWQAVVYMGEKGADRTVWSGWARREELSPILADLVVNEDLEPKSDDAPEVETVRDLLECWVAAQKKRVDLSDSWRRSAKHSGKRLCARIGSVKLTAVDRTVLERYRDESLRSPLNPEGIATGTLRQDLKRFRAAWVWGQELGLVPERLLPRVGVKVVPVRDKRTPTRSEVLSVLEHLDDAWPRLAVILLFATGARIGEIARLCWGDIDFATSTLHIREGKTGARDVPLHPETLAELRAWLPRDREAQPDEGLFGVSWKVVRGKLSQGPLERACKAAGVPKFTPHGLRRAAVDAFRRADIDAKTAASFLGQSDTVMLQYYAQATADDHRRALLRTQLGSLNREEIEPPSTPDPKPVQPTRTTSAQETGETVPRRLRGRRMAHPEGLEPPTLGSEVRCSVH
jgi:integrase